MKTVLFPILVPEGPYCVMYPPFRVDAPPLEEDPKSNICYHFNIHTYQCDYGFGRPLDTEFGVLKPVKCRDLQVEE